MVLQNNKSQIRKGGRKHPRTKPAKPASAGRKRAGESTGPKTQLQRTWKRAAKTRRCAAAAVVGEWDGKRPDVSVAQAAVGGRGSRATTAAELTAAARALAALGHPVRLRIMRKLLDAPMTYAALRKLTRLGAGPLYHHVGTLRLAGLIMPKQRDLYELTRGGRNMILLAMTVPALAKDRRRRPVAT